MKRKFTFLLMALLALAGFKSWGQDVITIGTEATTNQDIPFNGYYKYSYAQMLYLGSEIGESGTITSISFYVTQAVSKDYTLDVYMRCVDKSEFSHGDDWISVTTDDLVYQTQFFNASSTGWKTITLSNPFQYNSDQNLMIAFDNNTGSYAGSHNFKTSYDGATGIYQRDDNLNISPFDPYGGTLASFRPIIQITIEPTVSCPAPTNLAASNITTTGATISWTGNGAESYDLAYGVASTFDLNNSATYTPRNGLTATSVQLTGLTAETEYKCAVKANCSGEEESDWSDVISFLPTDKIIVDFESGIPSGWTLIDADGDGHNWQIETEVVHGGSKALSSASYDNGYAYTPDNYFISPKLSIQDDASMSFYAESIYGYNEPFSVLVSTTGTSTSDFTAIQTWNPFGTNPFTQLNVDLSDYAGQEIHIAFRHNGSRDQFRLIIDDISINLGTSSTKYNITYVNDGVAEHGTFGGPARAAEDATVTLIATPDEGYQLEPDSWVVTKSTGGTVDVTNNQFTMPACDVTVSATFTELPRYTVNVTNPTNGVNTTATLSATPNTGVLKDTEVRLSYSGLAEGYKFLNYVATNATTSELVDIQQKWDGTLSQNYYYFTMPDANVNLTASVKKIRTINVAEMQHGNLYLYPNNQITAGETITISPTPDYGYELGTLTITKVSGGTITPEQQEQWGEIVYTFEMPEDDVNIAATFASTGTLYTVTLPEETEIGRVSAYPADEWESSTEYFENDQVRIYGYVYNSNYYLKSVVVKKNSDQTVVDFYQQEGNNYYFIMPADNVTVTATFEEKPRYTVNVPAFTGGTVTASETSVMANTMVYLDYAANDGYTFAGITIKKDSDMSEVYCYDGSWYGHSYYFVMPEDNVTVNAEFKGSLTVCNGSETNQYIPVYGYYCDASSQQNQFIIPAEQLADMNGGTISNMTFYLSSPASDPWNCTWTVKLMETTETTISSLIDVSSATSVYTGVLNGQSSTMEVPFTTTSYVYNGGNLLVDFSYSGQGSYKRAYFYGVSASANSSYCSYYSYGYNNYPQSFLPKTTFSYTPAVKYNIAIDGEMENGTVLASAESAAAGETITLTPQPEAGYGFTAWNVTTATGSVTVNDNNQFTMPASDVTVSATFGLLDRYTVTVNQPTEGATLSVDPTTDWYEGLEVKLNCELAQGYQFGGWIVTSESTTLDVLHNDSENYDYFVMPAADVTVTATINKVYAISIAPTENGEIYTYPANNAAVGTQVEVYAYPADGYYLESLVITDQSGEVEHDAYNRFIMPASDVTVTATFNNAHYSITLNEPENGTLTADIEDLTDVFPTSYVTFTATPATHYHLSSLTIMANEEEVPVVSQWENNYMIQMPASNVEVTATFEEDAKYTVSLVYNEEGGSINLGSSGNTEYYAGEGVYVYFTPETGYILYSLEAEDSDQTPVTMSKYTDFYKFNMPEDDVTVTAEFVHGVTVNDGINTNEYVPFYGYYANYGLTKSQFIIPETSLSALQYNIVNGLVFYTSSPQNQTYSGSWDVYIKIVPTTTTTLTGYIDLNEMDEKVYTGNMVIADNKMVVTFDVPVQYNYGNLLICFNQTSNATNNTRTYWYGVNQSSNTAYAGYNYYVDNSQARQFLPKVTFLYEPGEPLPEYNITFHSNGIVSEPQTFAEGQPLPAPTNIPTGLTFAGWAAADIATYTEVEPEYVTAARAEEDLYAVFSYSEAETTSKGAGTWIKVTDVNELANNDKVVFVYNNYIMSQRSSGYYSYSVASVSIENGVITNIPDNAIEFTLVKNGDNWKLQYFDNAETPNIGETTLAYTGYDLVPHNFFSYTYPDTWTAVNNANAVNFKETECEYTRYIAYNGSQIKGNSNNPCQVYKASAPVVTHYYYMTEVFTAGNITANTELKNIIITEGTVSVDNNIVLTMNENGLFRNENAANFVFGYGAQLITDNAGVLATMKKHINGIEWYTISSPLANSVEFAEVENLIPGNDVTNTTYDLYYLNEAEGWWVNARPETGQSSSFTKIDKGRGYIYANNAGADHIAFAGEVNVAPAECTLTNGAAHGFNLIGNPFMQNIKLTDVKSDGTAVLADGFYVLNNDNTWATEPITTGTIAPLQGFLVQATTAGDVTISKPTSSSKGERSEQNTNIEMIVSNSIYRDNAYAMFGEGTGLNKVSHRNAQAPMLYIPQDGEDFAIAFMDENTTVFPLSFKAMTTGSYSISLKPTDDVSTLVLVDNMTGEETNMLLEDSYTFIGSPADNENRFTVKLSISNSQDEDEHFAYQNGSELVINGEGTLQIFDILGRVVVSEEVHGQTVNVGGLNTGAYIVRLTGESVKTQKIVVR